MTESEVGIEGVVSDSDGVLTIRDADTHSISERSSSHASGSSNIYLSDRVGSAATPTAVIARASKLAAQHGTRGNPIYETETRES